MKVSEPFKHDVSKHNVYVCVSGFGQAEIYNARTDTVKTEYRRRKTNFGCMYAVMVDDIGTKIKSHKITAKPTIWVETSPKNYQGWYLFTSPVFNVDIAGRIADDMVASGLTDDSRDPGMKGVSRYGRMPGSINNKEKYGKPHKVRAFWGDPDKKDANRYSVEKIYKEFDLGAPPSPEEVNTHAWNYMTSGSVNELEAMGYFLDDPLCRFLFQKESNQRPGEKQLSTVFDRECSDGWKLEFTCPWEEEHSTETKGRDVGLILSLSKESDTDFDIEGLFDDEEIEGIDLDDINVIVTPSIGFKCFHRHDDMTLADIWQWARENGFDKWATENFTEEEKGQLVSNRESCTLDEDEDFNDLNADVEYALESANPKKEILKLKSLDPRKSRLIDELAESIKENKERRERELEAIKRLVNTEDRSLDVTEILPGGGGRLAYLLEKRAKAMGVSADWLLTLLIPTMATNMGTKHVLDAHPDAETGKGHSIKAIFWTLLIAPTGTRKSDVLDMFTKPLNILQVEERKKAEEIAKLKEEYADQGVDEEETPPIKQYLLDDHTEEVRIDCLVDNPTGICVAHDEAEAFITAMAKYKKSDGGSKAQLLSEWNGKSINKIRRSHEPINLLETSIQRLGATQPPQLKKMMGNHNDDQGFWARFLICLTPATYQLNDIAKLKKASAAKREARNNAKGEHKQPLDKFTKGLLNVHRRLDDYPKQAYDYLYSPDAEDIIYEFENTLLSTQHSMNEDDKERGAISKFADYLHRVALFLHILNHALDNKDGTVPTLDIEAHTADSAVKVIKFYMSQYERMLDLNSPDRALVGHSQKLLTWLKKKGGAFSVRDISKASVLRRQGYTSTSEYLEVLDALVQSELATVSKDGKYKAN